MNGPPDFATIFITYCLMVIMIMMAGVNSEILWCCPHRVSKNSQNCFCYNFVKLPPRLIYVNALPCGTQMLQIGTLRGDYLYQIARTWIIHLTETATW